MGNKQGRRPTKSVRLTRKRIGYKSVRARQRIREMLRTGELPPKSTSSITDGTTCHAETSNMLPPKSTSSITDGSSTCHAETSNMSVGEPQKSDINGDTVVNLPADSTENSSIGEPQKSGMTEDTVVNPADSSENRSERCALKRDGARSVKTRLRPVRSWPKTIAEQTDRVLRKERRLRRSPSSKTKNGCLERCLAIARSSELARRVHHEPNGCLERCLAIARSSELARRVHHEPVIQIERSTAADGSQQPIKNQNLLTQIQKNFKRLVKESTGKASLSFSTTDTEASEPVLQLEVFPEPEYEIIGAFRDGYEIKVPEEIEDPELNIDFHDESQPTNEYLDISVKPKAISVERNPGENVPNTEELKTQTVAQITPLVENDFMNNENNSSEVSKKTTEIVSSYSDHSEKIYEFGKYVAEQMMCFDKKDVYTAQLAIKEVLVRYKLKYEYKLMLCPDKPNGKPAEEGAAVERSLKTTDKLFTRRRNFKPIRELKEQNRNKIILTKNTTIPTPGSVLTAPNTSSVPTKPKTTSVSTNPKISQLLTNNRPRASDGPSADQPVLSQLADDSLNSSPVAPLGFVTSSNAAPQLQMTNRFESDPLQGPLHLHETSQTGPTLLSPATVQTESQVNPSTSIPPPSMIHIISKSTSELRPSNFEPPTTQEMYVEKMESNEPLFPHVTIVESIKCPGSAQEEESVITEVIHIINEPESLVIKYEETSDNET